MCEREPEVAKTRGMDQDDMGDSVDSDSGMPASPRGPVLDRDRYMESPLGPGDPHPGEDVAELGES